MSFTLEGSDCMPSVSGGYLLIKLDNNELATVGVPSPIFADRHRDSVNENDDEFEDEEGNRYRVMVYSSNVGVDWEVTIDAMGDETELKKRVAVEYQANDF